MKLDQPQSFEKRLEVAGECRAALTLTIPQLVDDMENKVARAYNAMPDRLFVLDADAKVAYRGGRGPRGFEVKEMQAALEKILEP